MAAQIIPVVIGSMANGVSQQSPAMRLRDQVQEALNCRSTIVTGVGPRTGTEHRALFDLGVKRQGGAATPDDYANPLHITFDRGPDGVYAVLVTSTNLRVFNVESGVECTVTHDWLWPAFNNGSATNPHEDIRYVAAGDYLFLADRRNEQRLRPTASYPDETTAAEVNEGFVFCRASNYEEVTRIDITYGAHTYTWRVKAPSTAAGNGPLASANVALALHTILTTNTAPAAGAISSNSGTWSILQTPGSTAPALGFTVELRGAVVRITRPSGQLFTLNAQDQDNAKKIYHIQRSIPKFTDLPSVFWPEAIIKVSADAENAAPAYWVKYREVDENGRAVTGYWVECPAPGTMINIDKFRMPWALRATGGDTFEFGPIDWNKREVGSDDTMPPPSFIGQRIMDMFFVGGRLGIVTFDGVVTSRSNDQPFNFWRESSTQLLDTDPIDIISGGAESLSFHSCAVVGNEPVLFSAKSQYVLTAPSGEALSPVVADLKPTSSYQTPNSAPPIPLEASCYYVGPGSKYVSIHQFQLQPNEERTGYAKNIADHVPAYIRAPVKQLFTCQSENLLFVLAGGGRQEIYVYQYLDTEDKGRVQSAWTLWTFDAEASICGITVRGRLMDFLIRRGSQLYLETMDVGSDRLVGPSTDLIIMDRKLLPPQVSLTYDTLDFGTYVTVPYPLPADVGSYYCVVTEDNASGTPEPVATYNVRRVSDYIMKVPEDLRTVEFQIGRAPRVYVEPSEQVARNRQGEATFADASVVSVGPVLGQTAGLVMRVGLKSRRRYAKLHTVGQSTMLSPNAHVPMFDPPHVYGPGTGEYIYILRSEAEDAIPKRFFKAAGNVKDVLVAFENSGPLSFRIAGLVYRLAVKSSFTQ